MRNLQEQVKKTFYYQKLFWPFTVWIHSSSDLKIFENSRTSASNFNSFYRSIEQFFLTVGQNNFDYKIPFSGLKHNWRMFRLWCLVFSLFVFGANFSFAKADSEDFFYTNRINDFFGRDHEEFFDNIGRLIGKF